MSLRACARAVYLGLALALSPVAAAAPPSRELAAADIESQVEAIFSTLSLAEKAGQTLMLTAPGGTRLGAYGRRLLADVAPGGITLFRYHLAKRAHIPALTSAVRGAFKKVAPFIAVDQEGGRVSRIRGAFPRLAGGPALGRRDDPSRAEAAGFEVGTILRRLGFNMNLAPVLDVPREGGGRYLVARALSSNADVVARIGAAYVRGLQRAGVAAVAKHFPGEGTSRGDPHRGFPTARATRAVLERVDVAPFRAAAADAVMIGHVRYPALGGRDPASLSTTTYEFFRTAVPDGGLAITDGLEMKSIRARYGLARATVRALLSGADMVSIFWSPAKSRQAHAAIIAAVRSGELPRARLDEAVRRVLRAKVRRGIMVDRGSLGDARRLGLQP